jgi:hypothetical protein
MRASVGTAVKSGIMAPPESIRRCATPGGVSLQQSDSRGTCSSPHATVIFESEFGMHASLAIHALESACGRQSAALTASPGPTAAVLMGLRYVPWCVVTTLQARAHERKCADDRQLPVSCVGSCINVIGPIVFEMTLTVDRM